MREAYLVAVQNLKTQVLIYFGQLVLSQECRLIVKSKILVEEMGGGNAILLLFVVVGGRRYRYFDLGRIKSIRNNRVA